MEVIESVKKAVRSLMRQVAQALNTISGGKLSPNAITVVGFLAHIPIALLIAARHNLKAAALLLVFGLFDTLDGELARLQKRDGPFGMLLDSVTDRAKEVMLYSGAAYAITVSQRPLMAAWAAAACGTALLVSYVNAWGEVVTTRFTGNGHTTNKTFRTGLMTFEIRMLVLFVGLLSNRIILAMVVITVLAALTVLQRLFSVVRKLRTA